MGSIAFATAIECFDGRVQPPVADWLRNHFGVRYVDTITEHAAEKVLAQGPAERVEALRQQASASFAVSPVAVVAIAGHEDCEGNPISRAAQEEQIRQAVSVVANWGFPVPVVGLWVDGKGQIDVICNTAGAEPRS